MRLKSFKKGQSIFLEQTGKKNVSFPGFFQFQVKCKINKWFSQLSLWKMRVFLSTIFVFLLVFHSSQPFVQEVISPSNDTQSDSEKIMCSDSSNFLMPSELK
ncbi:MAG: hypothetical protein D6732_24610 [Methanobacteriota archaeon]|nr:MAG: hypothetical protein D6732_24610 [Euryarchaeota archaeon]